MQLGRHDVAPEVGLAVVAVAAVAQQQQLAAGGDDGGHPVGVAAALVGHLQLHAGLEAALQAGLHLTGGGGKRNRTLKGCSAFFHTNLMMNKLKKKYSCLQK